MSDTTDNTKAAVYKPKLWSDEATTCSEIDSALG